MVLAVASESQLIQDRQRFFAAPQPTPGLAGLVPPVGAPPTLTTGGPVRVINSAIEVSQDREEHGFAQEGPDFQGSTFTKPLECPWNFTSRIHPPSNLVGTIMPEIHHFMAAIFGNVTVTPGTSIAYNPVLARRGTRLSLARVGNYNDQFLGEWLYDAIPSRLSFIADGQDAPRFEVSGEAAGHVAATFTTLDGAISAASEITIANPRAVETGSILQVNGDNNAGAGYAVSARNAAGTGLTLPGATLTAPDGAEVRPFMPDPTYSLQPAFGQIEGVLSIGGVSLAVQSFRLDADLQTEFIKNEAFSSALTDGVPGKLMLTGTTTVRATESQVRFIASRKGFSNSTFNIEYGAGTVGRRLILAAPAVETWVRGANYSGQTSTIEVPFKCLDTVEGAADALTATWS